MAFFGVYMEKASVPVARYVSPPSHQSATLRPVSDGLKASILWEVPLVPSNVPVEY